MKEYDGKGFTPLFHSEVSSSYLLYDIFKGNEEIIKSILGKWFGLSTERIEITTIQRERLYPKKGTIDLFIEFRDKNKEEGVLLIEIKVHDYLSATDGQVITYYDAVKEDEGYSPQNIYFMYLTQFTQEDDFEGTVIPKTVTEARRAGEYLGERFTHISWREMHEFLKAWESSLRDEQRLMLSLNRQWMLDKCQRDLKYYKVELGERGLEDYFPDVIINLEEDLPFGEKQIQRYKEIWRIDLSKIEPEEFERLLATIKSYEESTKALKTRTRTTEEQTIEGARDYLTQLSQNETEWKLLTYLSRLFHYALESKKFRLYGTGAKGFSILVEVHKKGEISLCTIWKSGKIDFSLKR